MKSLSIRVTIFFVLENACSYRGYSWNCPLRQFNRVLTACCSVVGSLRQNSITGDRNTSEISIIKSVRPSSVPGLASATRSFTPSLLITQFLVAYVYPIRNISFTHTSIRKASDALQITLCNWQQCPSLVCSRVIFPKERIGHTYEQWYWPIAWERGKTMQIKRHEINIFLNSWPKIALHRQDSEHWGFR